MTYPPRIARGIKGPAWIIIPISENEVNRATFNACVRARLGSKLVNSLAELNDVQEFETLKELTIMKALKSFGPIDTDKDSDLKRLEDHIYNALKGT